MLRPLGPVSQFQPVPCASGSVRRREGIIPQGIIQASASGRMTAPRAPHRCYQFSLTPEGFFRDRRCRRTRVRPSARFFSELDLHRLRASQPLPARSNTGRKRPQTKRSFPELLRMYRHVSGRATACTGVPSRNEGSSRSRSTAAAWIHLANSPGRAIGSTGYTPIGREASCGLPI